MDRLYTAKKEKKRESTKKTNRPIVSTKGNYVDGAFHATWEAADEV
jgi:hypothetical protein